MTGFLNVWVSIKISFNMLDLSLINKTETKAVPKGTLFLFIEIKVIVLHCNVKYRNLEKNTNLCSPYFCQYLICILV